MLTGRNKRLIEQYAAATPFFGFTNIGRQQYRFLGLLELLRHYQENQADKKGALRKAWVFEFRIHEVPEIVSIGGAQAASASILSESRRSISPSRQEREVVALPEGNALSGEASLAEVEAMRGRLYRFAPYEFEHFIKSVLERTGFVKVAVTRASADGGVDLEAYVEDRNEFFAGTHVQLQVKRWRHSVEPRN